MISNAIESTRDEDYSLCQKPDNRSIRWTFRRTFRWTNAFCEKNEMCPLGGHLGGQKRDII